MGNIKEGQRPIRNNIDLYIKVECLNQGLDSGTHLTTLSVTTSGNVISGGYHVRDFTVDDDICVFKNYKSNINEWTVTVKTTLHQPSALTVYAYYI